MLRSLTIQKIEIERVHLKLKLCVFTEKFILQRVLILNKEKKMPRALI